MRAVEIRLVLPLLSIRCNIVTLNQSYGWQIMDLLDKTVDKTIAFIRAECKENIVSVDINLV